MVVSTQSKQRVVGATIGSLLLVGACTASPSADRSATDGAANQITAPAPSGKVMIDGSSTVYPITEAVAQAFRKTAEASKTEVETKFSGTSGGFKRFCAGETDISNASRPISLAELETCSKAGIGLIELPIAFDALTLAVHPQNSWAKDITIAELKKIWEPAAQGKITNWQQVRPEYPNRPLKLFGAGGQSGTFDYFNEVAMGDAKQSRTDYKASEDDNELVKGMSEEPNALGYIPFSYFEANATKLKPLAVNHNQVAVLPSRETVEKAQYQPFSRPLFIYVNSKAAQEKPDVKAFVEFYLKNAKTIVPMVNYIPLPDEAYRLAEIQFTRGEIGTVFEGVPQPNVTIAELLRRQTVFQLTAEK